MRWSAFVRTGLHQRSAEPANKTTTENKTQERRNSRRNFKFGDKRSVSICLRFCIFFQICFSTSFDSRSRLRRIYCLSIFVYFALGLDITCSMRLTTAVSYIFFFLLAKLYVRRWIRLTAHIGWLVLCFYRNVYIPVVSVIFTKTFSAPDIRVPLAKLWVGHLEWGSFTALQKDHLALRLYVTLLAIQATNVFKLALLSVTLLYVKSGRRSLYRRGHQGNVSITKRK